MNLCFVCVCALLELIKEVLSLDKKIKTIADELYEQKSLLVMGRGFNYATCLEGALVSLPRHAAPWWRKQTLHCILVKNVYTYEYFILCVYYMNRRT